MVKNLRHNGRIPQRDSPGEGRGIIVLSELCDISHRPLSDIKILHLSRQKTTTKLRVRPVSLTA